MKDARVIPSFLDVLVDKNEYDLARIEILRIIKLHASNESEYQLIGQALMTVLAEDPDDLVRNYSAQAISSYMGTVGAVELVRAVALDPSTDTNLRFSAFRAIERMGSQPVAISAMKDL